MQIFLLLSAPETAFFCVNGICERRDTIIELISIHNNLAIYTNVYLPSGFQLLESRAIPILKFVR